MSKTTEYHEDGSRTDRYSDGGSVTKDSEGNLIQSSRNESSNVLSILVPGGLTPDITVTRGPNGGIQNITPIKK